MLLRPLCSHSFFFFFFNDTATTEIYTLSLHDALPISSSPRAPDGVSPTRRACSSPDFAAASAANRTDRKSTRLNSSHSQISYAVFCLKKKKKKDTDEQQRRSITLLSSHYSPLSTASSC